MPTSTINKHKQVTGKTCTKVTKLITILQDHGGCLCMDINNSLNLQGSWHLPPSSLTLTRQTFYINLASETTPPYLLFVSLSVFLPSLAFNQIDYTESRAVRSTHRQVQETTQGGKCFASEGESVQTAYRRRPTPLEAQDKNGRDGNTLTTSSSCRVHNFQAFDSRQKFGCQPIKLELYPLSTRTPGIMYACTSGISGYIKRVE